MVAPWDDLWLPKRSTWSILVILGKKAEDGSATFLLHLWIGSVPLRRGTGLGSAVDKLRHQDLLGLSFEVFISPHPLHGIAGFQFSVAPRFLRQLGHHLSSLLGCLKPISEEVRVQLLAQQHLVVEDGTVFLQVGFPHPFARTFFWGF